MDEKHGAFRRMQGWRCTKVALNMGKRQDTTRCGLLTSLIKILYAKVIRAQYFNCVECGFSERVLWAKVGDGFGKKQVWF